MPENLTEAFHSYKTKPAKRARSAMTSDGNLVVSCWYAGFKRVEPEILRYEEDLSGQTGDLVAAFRAHLAEALSSECEVRVIVAMAVPRDPKAKSETAAGRTSYYARKDLVGRLKAFDGERLVIEFRRSAETEPEKTPRGASTRRAGLAR